MSKREKLQEACALLAQQVTLAREVVLDDATSDEQAAEALHAALAAANALRSTLDAEETKCPHCGNEDVRLRERVWRYYDLDRDEEGTLFADTGWPPDIDDDSDEPLQLFCGKCLKGSPLPEDFDFEWG